MGINQLRKYKFVTNISDLVVCKSSAHGKAPGVNIPQTFVLLIVVHEWIDFPIDCLCSNCLQNSKAKGGWYSPALETPVGVLSSAAGCQ